MPSVTPAARALLAVSLVAVAAIAAHAAGAGGANLDGVVYNGAYNVALVAAALLCLLRASRRSGHSGERAAWLCIGLGLAAWSAADIGWSILYGANGSPTSFSAPDLGYLLYYALVFIGLGLLIRDRSSDLRPSMWLDGIVEGLVVAALAAALLAGPVLNDGTAGDPGRVVVSVAYPILDVLMIGFVVAAFALSGWRPGRAWALLGAGLAVGALADVLYLYLVAVGGGEGHLLDALWPASVTLIGAAAWQPSQRATARPVGNWTVAGFPALAAALAGGLLVVAAGAGLNPVSRVLAAAALAAALARMALTLAENTRMLHQSRHEALTDGLTGLGNRRKLVLDLERELASPGGDRVLALFDLDGFKQYNDAFGHPAGDVLLARLGARLGATVARGGDAYRMGGDEFCALLRVPHGADPSLAVQVAAQALSERGEGFSVSSSFGSVALGKEATDAIEALQLADRRMYSQKDSRRSSARRQARDVLLKALDERRPELSEHLRDVADLAVGVGTRLGMGDQALEEVARAAELHDVGKVAVPDAILDKPGPLEDDEWAFVRQHTLIGERILDAAPALRGAARLVRSSHERWDGTGYPDGLAGEEIPLGARIVAVCDAFDALTSGRPYRAGVGIPAALDRLRSSAGPQFDPRVVGALEQELDARGGYEPGSTRSSPRRSRRRPMTVDASSAAADSAI